MRALELYYQKILFIHISLEWFGSLHEIMHIAPDWKKLERLLLVEYACGFDSCRFTPIFTFVCRQSQQSGPLQFDLVVAVRRAHPGLDLGLRVLQTGPAFRYTRRPVQTTSESGWTAHCYRHVHGTLFLSNNLCTYFDATELDAFVFLREKAIIKLHRAKTRSYLGDNCLWTLIVFFMIKI